MKKYLLLFIIPVILSFLPGCNSNKVKPDEQKNETNEQRLNSAKELDKRFVAAFNASNTDELMKNYWKSPDLVSYSPVAADPPDWKKSDITWYRTFEAVKGAKLQFTGLHNRVEGELVLGWGSWTITDSTGQTKANGKYTNVKARRDGKWVYIMDNMAAQAPPLQLLFAN